MLVGTQGHDYVRHRNQEPVTLADMTAEGCEHEDILLIKVDIKRGKMTQVTHNDIGIFTSIK